MLELRSFRGDAPDIVVMTTPSMDLTRFHTRVRGQTAAGRAVCDRIGFAWRIWSDTEAEAIATHDETVARLDAFLIDHGSFS